MKICQLCTVDFTLYHFLLPLMVEMRAAGHDVVGVCADGKLAGQVREAGFRVEPAPLARSFSPFRAIKSFVGLYKLLRQERFDLVHVHTPAAAFVGRLAARLAGVPRIVYTAHGFYFHENMAWPKRALVIAMEWLAGRFTHTLFTQSAEDAATARRLGLCRTGDIVAIGNGSDPARFHPNNDAEARQKLRAANGATDTRPVIVMIGRLVAEKGYPELVEAMRPLDADLWIVGDRLASDHARSIDDTLNAIETDPALSQKIKLLGYRGDVPELLRAGDIFVLPSHREGMPRSIIEAMLTGLPVVATTIRGGRELVVEGETGLLVPVDAANELADTLRSLITDSALRSQMGAAGLARARELYDEAKIIARQLDHLGLSATGQVNCEK
ncbi:MAG: glycosyltransferase [Alphaproteobacteria bacterium]|nr:glycosyltransferase [Alphaproteobacteria bacterium]